MGGFQTPLGLLAAHEMLCPLNQVSFSAIKHGPMKGMFLVPFRNVRLERTELLQRESPDLLFTMLCWEVYDVTSAILTN